MFVCCWKKCRRRSSVEIWNEVQRKTSVDIQSMTGSTCFEEKIQPELEYLSGMGLNLDGQNVGLGRLHYSIDYDYQNNDLIVSVLQCADLPLPPAGKSVDSFVKCYIRPRSETYETQVIEKSCNPIYNNNFLIQIPIPELHKITLLFKIYELEHFSRQRQIGKVSMSLEYVDVSNVLDIWSYIQKPDASDDECTPGELCITLRYVPTAENLCVTILEAKDLKFPGSWKVAADAYVKISLVYGSKLMRKMKTSVKKNSDNPYFNESFAMSLPQNQMKSSSLILSLKYHNIVGKSVTIGRVTFGCNTSGLTLRHWLEMMTSPRKPITQWHCLVRQ